MEKRELELRWVRPEVFFEPAILGASRRPVGVVVVLVLVRGAGVRAAPGGLEHVEAGVAGVEGVPGAGVIGRAGSVYAAIGLGEVAPARARSCHALRPDREERAVEPMVADRVEEWDRGARLLPERGPEDAADIRARLHEVAIVRLAARRVGGVAGADREAHAALCDPAHHVRLPVRASRLLVTDRSPVAEDREREWL